MGPGTPRLQMPRVQSNGPQAVSQIHQLAMQRNSAAATPAATAAAQLLSVQFLKRVQQSARGHYHFGIIVA